MDYYPESGAGNWVLVTTDLDEANDKHQECLSSNWYDWITTVEIAQNDKNDNSVHPTLSLTTIQNDWKP